MVIRAIRTILIFAAIAAGFQPSRGEAGPLDPNQFASLGDLNLTSGLYQFGAGTGGAPTLAVSNGISFTTIYTGVYSSQGVAVFDFGSINIGSNVSITANAGLTGPIALLSRSNETIAGRLDVSGGDAFGGPGASNAERGQDSNFVVRGPGAAVASGAGGGGFATPGSRGADALSFNGPFVPPTVIPGAAGGNGPLNLNNILTGGSAGGNGFLRGGGGGGGIELGAVGTLTFSGFINANGGDAQDGFMFTGFGAGGGSGGGIFLHGNSLNLSGSLQALGGAGSHGGSSGFGRASAGGAGGLGLILAEYDRSGTYQNTAQIGGVFFSAQVPEPSSLVMLGLSTVGVAIVSAFRRRRQGVTDRAVIG